LKEDTLYHILSKLCLEEDHVPGYLRVCYSRIKGVDRHARSLQPLGQFAGEEYVGQLTLAVGYSLVVKIRAVDVIHLNLTPFVGPAGDHHHPTRSRPLQHAEQ